MPSLDINGTRINYRETGSGPWVVLLHCSSSHAGQWKPLMDAVSDRFHLVAPDFHGYGLSGPLPATGEPFFRHDTAIIGAIMDMAEGPVHIVGHSLGGAIAARAVLDHGHAIASAILIEPVLFNLLEEAGDPRWAEVRMLERDMMGLIDAGDHRSAAERFMEFWAGPGALRRLDDETRDYVVATIGRVGEEWRGVPSDTPGALRMSDFVAVDAPTLLLCAAKTKPSARGIMDILRTAIPHAEYDEIADAGHMSPVSHPDAVNAKIIAFLDRQVAPG